MGSPRVRCWPLAAMLAFGHLAWADDAALDEARQDIGNSDYLAARTALDKALHGGLAQPDEVAEIYKLSGIVEGALDDSAAAALAFSKWLELDPKGALPAGTSPKIMRPFKTAATRSQKKHALEVKADTSSDPPSVTLVIVNDPMKLIAKAHVIVVADGKPEEVLDGKPETGIELPRGRRLDLRVQALDEYGNRVFELGSKSVPLVITAGATDADHAPHADSSPHAEHAPHANRVATARPRDWYAQWWVWGTATIAMTVVTGVFAYETHAALDDLDVLNRNSLDHPFSDAQAVESRAHRDIAIADVAAGAAGVFAIGTAILYLTRPHLERSPVAAVPMRGGGAIVLGGHF